MRLVSVRREAHYRGYRIEGFKQGEGMLLRVTPTRPCLPTLKYSRFRTLRASWEKAAGVVTGYIDEALNDALHQIPPEKHAVPPPRVETNESSGQASQVEEPVRLKARRVAGGGRLHALSLPIEAGRVFRPEK